MKAQNAATPPRASFPRRLKNLLEWLAVLGASPPGHRPPAKDALQLFGASESAETPHPTCYVMNSLFPHRCYRRLMRVTPEDLHLATGIMLDGRFILTDIVVLSDVQQSPAGAFATPAAVRTGLLLMEAFGLRCGALFHSHPGVGARSTLPSGIDLRNHEAWEKAYPLIGAIFSRSGHVRFFTSSGIPEVHVVGERARRIDGALYTLRR
jgi:proteasome lid subunit RPN8/RPN11